MIIGLTGGIGSGKSTVCAMLEAKGITCIEGDEIIQEMYKQETPIYKRLVVECGDQILDTNGNIDLDRLRQVGVSKRMKTRIRNMVWKKVVSKQKLMSNSTLVFASSRIVEEKFPVDYIVLISSTLETRRNRANRRGTRTKTFNQVIKGQLPLTELLPHAKIVLENNKSIKALEKKVEKLAEKIKQL